MFDQLIFAHASTCNPQVASDYAVGWERFCWFQNSKFIMVDGVHVRGTREGRHNVELDAAFFRFPGKLFFYSLAFTKSSRYELSDYAR